jgi:hypothetical protein
MVKVPVGKIVKVDLWDSKKKRGMVKYQTNTMNLVRAESEFELEKGKLALVIESHESFVLIVPKDEYTALIRGKDLKRIDYQGLAHLIYNILKDRLNETGGILSFEEIYSILKRTSIQDIIRKKHIMKAVNFNGVKFDRIKEGGKIFIVLRASDCPNDEIVVLNLAKDYSFLTLDTLQRSTKWSSLRCKRILDYFVEKKRCKKESSYLSGDRYYFQNN